jgi:hypothetical protein
MCIAASAQISPLRSRISAQDRTNSLLKAEALICGDTESELESRQESLPIFSASLSESFCHAGSLTQPSEHLVLSCTEYFYSPVQDSTAGNNARDEQRVLQ